MPLFSLQWTLIRRVKGVVGLGCQARRRYIVVKSAMILLSNVDDIRQFVDMVKDYNFDVDLVAGRYTVDAKSIMGIFGLDLSKPIEVQIHSDDCVDFIEKLKAFQPSQS